MNPRLPGCIRAQRCRSSESGFTLVEVAVAGGLLVVLVAALALSMTQINRWASAARLNTLAQAVAQQKIDQAITTPWMLRNARPSVLTAGTTTESNLSLNCDTHNTEAGISSAFTNLSGGVNATRVTQVTDLGARLVRISVTVSYTYSGRTYSVRMATLRTSDDI